VPKESELPSVYLDSCCFIDVVKHKFGKQLGDTQEKHLIRLKEGLGLQENAASRD
jgi:hypothetical protein